tara:strand:+ start:611 stop:790 length:180 start_codon:yes stop_codon:yes gene_type:complete
MHNPNQPRNIIGPSGATVRPTIREIRVGDEIRTEAHYTDPRTGQFITKIPVSVRKVDDK